MPLLNNTNNKTAKRKNWIIVTAKCVVLIKGDLALRFAVIRLVYSKRIHEPIPYPMTTVNVKSMISEVLFKYKIWRVANKSKITSTTITPEVTTDVSLLPTKKLLWSILFIGLDDIYIITATNIL